MSAVTQPVDPVEHDCRSNRTIGSNQIAPLGPGLGLASQHDRYRFATRAERMPAKTTVDPEFAGPDE